MREWLELACRPDIVRRALKVALIVGTALTLINQGNHLLGGTVNLEIIIKISLTYCVPYAVSTYAAVGAVKDHQQL